jgi:hypothetical protein
LKGGFFMMYKNWNRQSAPQKVLIIFKAIISAAILIFVLQQILNVWAKSVNVVVPLLGFLMLIQAIETRKTNKPIAYLSLFVAVIAFVTLIKLLFR